MDSRPLLMLDRPPVSDLEDDLREIYARVGKPEAFIEAREKVTDLAEYLVARDGIDLDDGLRIAYGRSLAEHREYLAANGLE